MSWLDLLLKQTEESEAPERYFWWSGLATISAVVRKNIWINRHFYKLYPNVYVALISSKSGARKGIPVSICKKILEKADLVRIISGCNSIQGMIQELGSQKTLASGAVINEAHGILLSGEFDAFLTEDPKALTHLTELYNTHEHEIVWEKTLKNSPKVSLKSPCLTMLVASNEMLFDSVVKRKDIEGGFIGRTVLVRESKARRINSLVYAPNSVMDIDKLTKRLTEISKIKGEFKWTDESAAHYKGWYEDLMSEETDDRTGTYNRLGDQVIKVAMLISLARKDSLDLELRDVKLAIEKCEECADTAARITPSNESMNGDKPNTMKLIIQFVSTAPNRRIAKVDLMSRLQKYQVYSIDAQMNQLLAIGWIARAMTNGDGDINSRTVYYLTDLGMKQFLDPAMKKRAH